LLTGLINEPRFEERHFILKMSMIFEEYISFLGRDNQHDYYILEFGGVVSMLVFLHMRYERYSIYYYNNECSIYREHKVTIHERMCPLNNQ
jgi:hypothetical protein